jgi:hypothetical protein
MFGGGSRNMRASKSTHGFKDYSLRRDSGDPFGLLDNNSNSEIMLNNNTDKQSKITNKITF